MSVHFWWIICAFVMLVPNSSLCQINGTSTFLKASKGGKPTTAAKSAGADTRLMKILLGIFIPLIVIILLVLLFVFRERIPLFKRFCYKDVFVDDDEPALPSIEYYNAPGCTVPSKIPPPIPIKEFAASLEELNSKSEFPVLFKTVEGLAKAEIEDKYRLTKHVAENNRPRNRYMDVLPYDQSLVLVGRPWSTASSDPEPRFTFEQVSEGYINASYVRRPEYGAGGEALVASVTSLPEYIATQGPLESTAADFLTMVCEQRSPLIIMLCQCTDGNREKCAQYWPDGVTQTFHSVGRRVEVKKESEGLSGSVIRRQLKIRPMSEKFPWIVTQVQFTAWIDHNVPNMESLYSLIAMQNSVLAKHHVGDEYGPTIVHCSAGAGRTGTFMAAVYLLDRLRKNPQNVDIIGTVLAMRKWRADLVQAWSQLQFLYNFTNFCLIKEQRGTRRPAPVAKSLPSVEYMNSGEAPYLPAMQRVRLHAKQGDGNESLEMSSGRCGTGSMQKIRTPFHIWHHFAAQLSIFHWRVPVTPPDKALLFRVMTVRSLCKSSCV